MGEYLVTPATTGEKQPDDEENQFIPRWKASYIEKLGQEAEFQDIVEDEMKELQSGKNVELSDHDTREESKSTIDETEKINSSQNNDEEQMNPDQKLSPKQTTELINSDKNEMGLNETEIIENENEKLNENEERIDEEEE